MKEIYETGGMPVIIEIKEIKWTNN
jgi:hypothetical protein